MFNECWSLKQELPGRVEEMLTNKFNRSETKCWMIWIYLNISEWLKDIDITFQHKTFHKHSSWSTGEMDSTHKSSLRSTAPDTNPKVLDETHHFWALVTRTNPEPRTKETNLNTWHEHIEWVAWILNHRRFWELKWARNVSKRSPLKSSRHTAWNRHQSTTTCGSPYKSIALPVLQWAWTSWCDLEEVMHLFLEKHPWRFSHWKWHFNLILLENLDKPNANVGIDLKKKYLWILLINYIICISLKVAADTSASSAWWKIIRYLWVKFLVKLVKRLSSTYSKITPKSSVGVVVETRKITVSS